MTYCVGMCLAEGIVMLADTRTNAGLDNVSTFSKLHVFEAPGERVIAVMTAGNLAVTQAVISLITQGVDDKENGETQTLWDMTSVFDTARLVGKALRHVYDEDADALEKRGVGFDAGFIVAGQLHGRRMRMFQVYSAGNFIESSKDTPFLQIGEHKYGKPILDRVCMYDTPLKDAVSLGLISMDSTLRSNLSVGLPLDLIVFGRDALRIEINHRIGADDPYFRMISDRWSASLRSAYRALPPAPWMNGQHEGPEPKAVKRTRSKKTS